MPAFRVGDVVVDIRTGETAVVRDVDDSTPDPLYLVESPSGRRYMPEARLGPARRDPLDLLRSGRPGDAAAFHRRLQALLLQHAYQPGNFRPEPGSPARGDRLLRSWPFRHRPDPHRPVEPAEERLFAAYRLAGQEESAGLELICRITTEGLRRNAHIVAVRVDEHGHGSVRYLDRWTGGHAPLAPDTLPFRGRPGRLELAIKQATGLLGEEMNTVLQRDKEAARRWHPREVARESRIHEKRHAAAQVERAAQRVHAIEEAHREALEQLQARVELLPAFEILAASLLQVTPPTRRRAKPSR